MVAGQLPLDWGLPDWIQGQRGRLGCTADIRIHSDGKKVTGGTGEATVSGVKLGGETTTVKLRLQPTAQGLRLGEPGENRGSPARNRAGRGGDSVDITLNLKDADLAQLIKDLGVDVPFEVGGRLATQVEVSLPVDRPRDLGAYRVNGTISLPTLTICGMDMTDVSGRVDYADGVLRVDEVRGWVGAGLHRTKVHSIPISPAVPVLALCRRVNWSLT